MAIVTNVINFEQLESWNRSMKNETHRSLDDVPAFLDNLPGAYMFYYHGSHPFYELQVRHGFGVYVGLSDNLGRRLRKEHPPSFDTSLNIKRSEITYTWISPETGPLYHLKPYEDWVAKEENIVWNTLKGLGLSPCMGRPKAYHSIWDWIHSREKWRQKPAPSHLYNLEEEITKIRDRFLEQGHNPSWTVKDILALSWTSPIPNTNKPKKFGEPKPASLVGFEEE